MIEKIKNAFGVAQSIVEVSMILVSSLGVIPKSTYNALKKLIIDVEERRKTLCNLYCQKISMVLIKDFLESIITLTKTIWIKIESAHIFK
jgi:hypothetical protein